MKMTHHTAHPVSAVVALRSLAATIGLLFTLSQASAQLVTVHANFAASDPGSLAGPAGGSGETWNNATRDGGQGDPAWTQSSLLDSTGATTGISYTMSGAGFYNQGSTTTLTMLNNGVFINNNTPPVTLTITGLDPGGTYDIYFAGFSSNWDCGANFTTGNTTTTVGTQTYSWLKTDQSSTWMRGQNYVLFEDVEANVSGTITLQSTKTTSYTFYSGFQLVQVAAGTGGADTTPPAPDSMTWAVEPTAAGGNAITMSATAAIDPSGVEYYFDETSGNPGGSDSGWQESPHYTDTGLSPDTPYTYTVTARDKSPGQNATAPSSPAAGATTASPPFGLVVNVNIDGFNQSRTGLIGPAGGSGETWAQSITGTHAASPWTQSPLPDSTGATTGIGYVIANSGGLFRQDQTAAFEVLQSALFVNNNNPTTLTINGLNPSSYYDIYIAAYASTYPTTMNWSTGNATSTVGTQTYANTSESANWVLNNNYVKFDDVAPDGSGTIVMEGVKTSAYGFISGFQLVEVPKPADPVFRITSFSPVAVNTWELTLEADPGTLYEFRSSPDLSFNPGTLIENLTQGNPGTDPGTITGTNSEFVTTNGAGLATVRVTLAGPKNFVRAQEPGPLPLLSAVRAGMPRKIVIIGTSLSTATYGNWPALLETWLKSEAPDPAKVTVANLAVSGSNSQTGGINKLADIKGRNPDTVFMEFSMNDAYTPYAISQVQSETNHNFIINDLLTFNPDMEIIVQTMNNPAAGHLTIRPDIAAYYQVARNVATAQGLLLIDHYPNWLDLYNTAPAIWSTYVPDNIHPISTGYDNILMPELQQALEP
jgi:lysophospholipase L1-like esterase